jgi:FixJ family two-component response regulator
MVHCVPGTHRDKAILVNSAVISIIDDDLATRSALAALMRAKGFSAKAYESAEDFLHSGGQDDSRCIITDIHMSGMSGIDLKERLNEGHCTVPVIMITARVEDRLHERARDVGAFCLLRKPFKAEALIACIEKALTP